MNINLSDAISGAALVLSFGSAYYAKVQSQAARVANYNDYRAHLSSTHERYRALLRDVKARHKEGLSKISSDAGEILRAVLDKIDNFECAEIKRPTRAYVRPLRHLLGEASEMLFYAFNGQLGRQTGLNLAIRFAAMRNMETRLEPSRWRRQRMDFRNEFRAAYFKDRNARQELTLLGHPQFCGMVVELKERVDETRSAELLVDVQRALVGFRLDLAALQRSIEPTLRELETALEEAELEQFSLVESPMLFGKLRTAKGQLDALRYLDLPTVAEDHAHHFRNYIAISICTCAVLNSIQCVHSWGWDNE